MKLKVISWIDVAAWIKPMTKPTTKMLSKKWASNINSNQKRASWVTETTSVAFNKIFLNIRVKNLMSTIA